MLRLLSLLCSLALVASQASAPGVARAEETVRLTGRVDRVFTDQFFTINDGRAGGDQPVFIPHPGAPPVRGDRITVVGVMRPFDWSRWVRDEAWFRAGWGLVQDALVKFDGQPVLVAESAVDPQGHDLVQASRVEQAPRPLTGRTLGERKMLARAGRRSILSAPGGGAAGAADVAHAGGTAPSGGGGGSRDGRATPGERGAASPPGGSGPGTGPDTSAGAGGAAGTGSPERPAPGALPPGERQGVGPQGRRGDEASSGAPPGEDITGLQQGTSTSPSGVARSGTGANPATGLPRQEVALDPGTTRLITPTDLVTDPQSWAGREVLVSGTVSRRLDPGTVELRSGATGAPLLVRLEGPDVTLREGQTITVTGRLRDRAEEMSPGSVPGRSDARDSDARAGKAVDARGNERAPAFTGRVLSDEESRTRIVAATARAIARDPALFVGRRVSLVADAAEVVGPRTFLLREEGAAPRDTVLVVVSPGARMPREPGPVRVDGRVEILSAGADPDSRIDPAWLEGVDRDVFEGRPVIVADSVTIPGSTLPGPGL